MKKVYWNINEGSSFVCMSQSDVKNLWAGIESLTHRYEAINSIMVIANNIIIALYGKINSQIIMTN